MTENYEFGEAIDLASMVSVAALPSLASTTADPIDWGFLDFGIHIRPDTLTYAGSNNEEDNKNGMVITITIPTSISADGQLVFNAEAETALSSGSEDDLKKSHQSNDNEVQDPADGSYRRRGLSDLSVVSRGSAGWHGLSRVETASRKALVPLGLVETSSGGWIGGDPAGEVRSRLACLGIAVNKIG